MPPTNTRSQFLHGSGVAHRVASPVVLPVVGARTAVEQTLHDLERVDEAIQTQAGAGHVHAERGVLGFVPAGTHPDVEAAAADAIDRRQRLRQHRRGPQRLERDERAEPNSLHPAARVPRA